ncbi:LRP8 protein, partial [Picathartes gymnocephalus]|nr:LRP8 protein [Picathartes gymnocephalus]
CAASRQAACVAGCIPVPWLCDGEQQCPDGTDEQCEHAGECCAVSSVCGKKKVQCPGTHHCIPHWELCDRHQDCEDGWDEEGCPQQPCLPGQWQCRNRVCIMAEWKCNGIDDCGDSSDEDVCAPCTPGMVRCDEGKCILESLMCDDKDDCLDGTDEPSTCGELHAAAGHCPSGWGQGEGRAVLPHVTLCFCSARVDVRSGNLYWLAFLHLSCSRTHVPCRDGTGCVAQEYLCDGEKDCADGSDEDGCAQLCNTPGRSHSSYPCGLGSCLNTSLVCNGQQDCADGSDEGGNCSVPCQRSCTHLCHPSPQGPRCWCGPGYRLAEDGLSCMDIDECMEWGKVACSQTCHNAPGSYSCGCLPGYLLEPNGHACKLTGPEPKLLVAVQSEVLSYGLRSGHEEVVLATDKDRVVFSLDYDLVERKVFWMDLATESIRWQDLSSGKKGTLVKGVRSDCIAVDWLGRNLYWTDGAAGQVLATRLGAAWQGIPEYTVVMDGDLDQPHSLVLQPLAGLMYWSEVGSHSRLMKASMDGSRRHVLLAQGLGWPTALALDLPTQRIFWLDEKLGSVGSAHLDGSSVKVLKLRWVQSPFAAAVCEGQLYWSERKTWSVQQVDKASGKNRTVLLKRHGQPHGLQVPSWGAPAPALCLVVAVLTSAVLAGTNGCAKSNGGCAQLCLPNP